MSKPVTVMQVPEGAESGSDITSKAIVNLPPPLCERSDASEVSLQAFSIGSSSKPVNRLQHQASFKRPSVYLQRMRTVMVEDRETATVIAYRGCAEETEFQIQTVWKRVSMFQLLSDRHTDGV
jgi:hypothetical protein